MVKPQKQSIDVLLLCCPGPGRYLHLDAEKGRAADHRFHGGEREDRRHEDEGGWVAVLKTGSTDVPGSNHSYASFFWIPKIRYVGILSAFAKKGACYDGRAWIGALLKEIETCRRVNVYRS